MGIDRNLGKTQSSTPSGFTPLHQAAYMGAPLGVVQQLIRLGAWSLPIRSPQRKYQLTDQSAGTARTLKEPDKDMTPLDLARSAGWEHLYDALAPVIRHTVPAKMLDELQRRLHELILTGVMCGPHLG